MGSYPAGGVSPDVLGCGTVILAEGINYKRGKVGGYRTYAFTLIRLSRHQEALEYSEKSLTLFESLNDLGGQTSIYEYYRIHN